MGKVLAFECEPGGVVGGYGDRIVGLVSVRVLARMLGREFRVRWTRDDLGSYLDYSGVALETKPTLSIKMIDRPEILRNELRQAPMPFVRNGTLPNVGISVNAEIAQYLFQNPRFAAGKPEELVRNMYLETMRRAYRTLYTEVLRPTERVRKRMQEVVGDKTGLVGVQVRAGDCFMQTGAAWDQRTRYMDGEAGVRAALAGVRRKLDELREAGRVKPGTGVFVTGDHPKVVALAWEALGVRGVGGGEENGGGGEGWEVLGDDEPAQHLDRRQSEKLDQTKLYADALVLAQRCSVLFISENSNFGRVAALAGGEGREPRVGQVYRLDGRELSELELLSKGEKVFMKKHGKIHIIGDSHSRSTFGWTGDKRLVSHWVGPILAYSFGSKPECDPQRYGLVDGDTVIFSFGEIDCRCHIKKHVTMNKPPQIVIRDIVRRYAEAVNKLVSVSKVRLARVCLYNIVPPARRNPLIDNPEYPFVGTDNERRSYHQIFNSMLKEVCRVQGWTFFDVYNYYSDAEGFLCEELSDGSVHIRDPEGIRRFIMHNNI